jgi:ribonuclease-3
MTEKGNPSTVFQTLLAKLDYQFTHPQLLRQALTHRSHGTPNYERLEFLGDSVLNCVVATQLYRRFPDIAEGDLSRVRSHLVKESTLSELAIALDLGNLLRLGDGELKSGGQQRPSVLADAVEALIGAIYLDGGFVAAEAVVGKLYASLLEGLDPGNLGKDAKTLLQEYLQGKKIALPQYTVVETTGEAHRQIFRVECHVAALDVRTQGEGGSRRAAEQLAADAAYQLIHHG